MVLRLLPKIWINTSLESWFIIDLYKEVPPLFSSFLKINETWFFLSSFNFRCKGKSRQFFFILYQPNQSFRYYLQSWTKNWRQIHEIRKNRFFYGLIYRWFLWLFTKKVKIWLLGGRLGTRHQIQACQGISWNCLIS